MKNSNDLVDKAVLDIETSPQSSATAAGPVEEPAQIDAINQIFALFRINFHNQFYSAFNDTQLLNQAKRLWLEALRNYSPECLLKAARQIIENSEYLPTLHKMLEACDQYGAGADLPSPRDAYKEACLAPSPRAQFRWSHPAVYLAGSRTGWYDLQNLPEYLSWPRFKEHYETLRRQVVQGDILPTPALAKLPAEPEPTLSRAEQLAQLKKLRAKLKI